jgi:hypothetical protein
MHLAQIFAPLIIKQSAKVVRDNRGLKARLINMRIAREQRGYEEPRTGFFDYVRASEIIHGRAWRSKALQYWFRHDADTYTCLFENVFTKTLSHLDALAAAGYDAMRLAESAWDAMPEKRISKFNGLFWTDEQSQAHQLIAADHEPAHLSIEMTHLDQLAS